MGYRTKITIHHPTSEEVESAPGLLGWLVQRLGGEAETQVDHPFVTGAMVVDVVLIVVVNLVYIYMYIYRYTINVYIYMYIYMYIYIYVYIYMLNQL
jgi:hypothetical protein